MIGQRFASNIVAGMVLVALFWALPACAAQDKMACGDEIEKFCSQIEPGQLSLTACLDARREELSVECRERVDQSLAKIDQAKKVCAADMEKFCAEVKPGGGRILACMVANRPQLSAACAQQVDKFTAARGAASPRRAEGK